MKGHRSAIAILNDALATEIVCVLRYKYHYSWPKASSDSVKTGISRTCRRRTGPRRLVSERIVELGGNPELNPQGWHLGSHRSTRKGPTSSK